MIPSFFEGLFSLIFPPECEGCGRVFRFNAQNGFCPLCASSVRSIPGPHCARCGRTLAAMSARCDSCGPEDLHFDKALACGYYQQPLKNLLHSFKFKNRKSLKTYLVRLMGDFLEQGRYLDWDAVIPVPMEPSKEKNRGFNQASLLARGLGRRFEKPVLHQALGCLGTEKPQSELGKEERKKNVRGRFYARRAHEIEGCRVLLVDDILTTGETASECARVLKDAGASSVTVLAAARGA